MAKRGDSNPRTHEGSHDFKSVPGRPKANEGVQARPRSTTIFDSSAISASYD